MSILPRIRGWFAQIAYQPLQRKGWAPPAPPDDPGKPTVDFRGENRSNTTHVSITDPEARLYTKARGQTPKLIYCGHVLTENRPGLAVKTRMTPATSTAERETGIVLAEGIPVDTE